MSPFCKTMTAMGALRCSEMVCSVDKFLGFRKSQELMFQV